MLLKNFEIDIKQNIPLAKALDFQLVSFENNQIILQAPFANNKNDKNTVFAGSQASLALLAGWSLVTLVFAKEGVTTVAAMKTEMHYVKPIEGDFEIQANFSKDADLEACRLMLTKKGRSKIAVDVVLREQGDEISKASFTGSYFLSS